MDTAKQRIAFTVIAVNLIIGNSILFIGVSNGHDVNYALMAGMSIACTAIYFLFFKYIAFENYSKLKLFFVSVLTCMVIIFVGNAIAVIIKQSIVEFIFNIPATIFMGIVGNMLFFPVSVILGALNFGIISYLNNRAAVKPY